MRIDLFQGGRRPLTARLILALFNLRAGIYPGPPLVLTYRPDFLTQDLNDYLFWGMYGLRGWRRGDVELFAAFVSSLNSCNF